MPGYPDAFTVASLEPDHEVIVAHQEGHGARVLDPSHPHLRTGPLLQLLQRVAAFLDAVTQDAAVVPFYFVPGGGQRRDADKIRRARAAASLNELGVFVELLA